jgi:hypothetical protein
VIVASLGWAGASLYARRTTLVARPLTSAGLQMVTAAGLLSVASGARGELGRIRPEGISPASAGAFVYLVVVGSIVGYPGRRPQGCRRSPHPVAAAPSSPGAAILSSVVLIVTARSARARASVLRFPARVREVAFSRAA